MPFLKAYQGKRVFVTGATGYLGSVLVRELIGQGAIVSTLSRRKISGLNVTSFVGDMREVQWERLIGKQDVIFHLAAQTNIDIAEKDVPNDWKTNCSSLIELIQACEKMLPKVRIIYTSTATVAGIPNELPVDESIVNPLTVYDFHKLYNEQLLKKSKIENVILRVANVYGPSPSVSKEGRGILNWMVNQAIETGKVTVFGTGQWIRDYVYIDDVIRAFLAAGCAPAKRIGSGIYNVSTGKGTTLVDAAKRVADFVEQIVGKSALVENTEPSKFSPIDKRNYIGDRSLIEKALGWVPQVPLEVGLRTLIEQQSYLLAA